MTALVIAGNATRGAFGLDVSVTIRPGEVTALLGPNGAGKTTLLRTVAGLNRLEKGRITLGDTVIDDPQAGVWVPPAERRLGVAFQDYRLFPHLDAVDNVGFGLRTSGASKPESRRIAATWLRRFGLADHDRRKPAGLSGGEAQRVALARALAVDPLALLLDEPLAALDAGTRADVRATLGRLLREFPGPVLLVTHDPVDAMVLADRLIVLERGRVVQDGVPSQVARRPHTAYIASLMGLNLYAGTLAPESASVALDAGGSLTPAEHPAPGAVHVGVRPGAISVHGARPGRLSNRNVWPATVTALEAYGDRIRLQCEGVPSALVDVTPAAVADLRLGAGSTVWLSVKATEVEVYPRVNGSPS